MKETKVWIDGEFPQVYFDPKTGNESIEGRPLILEDIKTHDRELVKKVCDDLALSLVEFSEDFAMSRDEILEWLQKYKDKIKKGV